MGLSFLRARGIREPACAADNITTSHTLQRTSRLPRAASNNNFSSRTRLAVARDIARRQESPLDVYAGATSRPSRIAIRRTRSGCPYLSSPTISTSSLTLESSPSHSTPRAREVSTHRMVLTSPRPRTSQSTSASTLSSSPPQTSQSTLESTSPSSPPRTSPPRSPKFTECFDDEFTPTAEDLQSGKAFIPRPLPSTTAARTLPSTITPRPLPLTLAQKHALAARAVTTMAKSSGSEQTSHSSPAASSNHRRFRSESRRAERARSESITVVPPERHDSDVALLGSAIESVLKLDSSPLTSRRGSDTRERLPEIKPLMTQAAQSDSSTRSRSSTSQSNATTLQRFGSNLTERGRSTVRPIPVQPPLYNPHEMAAYQWITPMISSSRPAGIWGRSKRWECCNCDNGETIVEQMQCSNLECAHIRCRDGCELSA